MIVGYRLHQSLSHLFGQLTAAIELRQDSRMLALKTGQQATLEGGYILERHAIEIPLRSRQQNHDLGGQRERLVCGLPERGL